MLGSIQTSMNSRFAQMSYGDPHSRRQGTGHHSSASVQKDAVTLSSNVPEPFNATEILSARSISSDLTNGTQTAPTATVERVRMDRVFAALAVLTAMQANDQNVLPQAMGIPTPTADELEAAYKKLSQHVRNDLTGKEPEGILTAKAQRLALVEGFRGVDFSVLVEAGSTVTA